jgi:uncharacterized membrane protein
MTSWTPAQVTAVVAIIAISGIATWLLTRGLIGAGQHPAPSMLVVSLSLLTLTALLGGLITGSETALALAGAGIGALAGAVSSTFTQQRRNRDDDPDP